MSSTTPSYKRRRFPPEIIAHGVWLYLRFGLSLRAVEEMLLERGIEVSYETLRRWVIKFGPIIARGLRRRACRPSDIWHLDEVRVMVRGETFWLWRAVDQNGLVLGEILQRRRDAKAAKRLLKSLLKRLATRPNGPITFTDIVRVRRSHRVDSRASCRADPRYSVIVSRRDHQHMPSDCTCASAHLRGSRWMLLKRDVEGQLRAFGGR